MKTLKLSSIFFAGLFATVFFLSCEEEIQKSTYVLDQTSVAEWHGAGPGAEHFGSFDVNAQDLLVEEGKIKSGTFVIPIASIKNFDLPDEVKPILLNHLKSADFFNMELFPETKYEITSVTSYQGNHENAIEGANYLVNGKFMMLGKTIPVNFPARISFEDSKMTAEALLKINRTLWGMNYAADPALGDHHIYPTVDIHLKLSGNKVVTD
jgi:polyisoprenoid-binding protein YceI